VLVRKAVLTVLIVEVSALNDEPRPRGRNCDMGTEGPPPTTPK
jgi:hypothetical protein